MPVCVLKSLSQFVEFSNQHQSKLFNDIRYIHTSTQIYTHVRTHTHTHMHIRTHSKTCYPYDYGQCFRRLASCYPHFPSEQELTHCILSTGDLQQHSQGGKLWLLARFAMEWPRLQMGGVLLPELVELYQWLDGNIAHLLTYEQASAITIGQVISLAERNLGRETGENVRMLYENVKLNYNRYVELIGGAIGAGACAAVRQGNRIFTIADDIPLLHFLTGTYEQDLSMRGCMFVCARILCMFVCAYDVCMCVCVQTWRRRSRGTTGCTW